MELLQLKYFCDAAESENFSSTAKKYGVPQSDISQSVRRLERELGINLFSRRANRISLNEKGREFYEKVFPALEMISDAADMARDGADGGTGGDLHQGDTGILSYGDRDRLEVPGCIRGMMWRQRLCGSSDSSAGTGNRTRSITTTRCGRRRRTGGFFGTMTPACMKPLRSSAIPLNGLE